MTPVWVYPTRASHRIFYSPVWSPFTAGLFVFLTPGPWWKRQKRSCQGCWRNGFWRLGLFWVWEYIWNVLGESRNQTSIKEEMQSSWKNNVGEIFERTEKKKKKTERHYQNEDKYNSKTEKNFNWDDWWSREFNQWWQWMVGAKERRTNWLCKEVAV